MRLVTSFLLLTLPPLWAQATDEKDTVATVQKVFDGMAARDAEAIRATMLSDARLYAVREDGTTVASSVDDFISRIGTIKGDLLERFTSKPTVSLRGRMAQVWGEYEFLHDGKFSHCGVDSVSLFRRTEGWKIAAVAYTTETTNCTPK
ncbi:MAG TPA: nuclear transport factor 2 family protein [Bryobacteraceae bacterium]|nr:nuclear transport factor 2 family protein [Bryobacteraceae bacterium]